jgi:diguanylate cyclase (GGDEF)-like protein/PAS domain S-box-containing protein
MNPGNPAAPLGNFSNAMLEVSGYFSSGALMTKERRNAIILEALLQVADDAFIFCGGDEKIEFANAAVERMFGYEPSELIGQPLETLIPKNLRAAHAKHVTGFRQGADGAKHMGDRKTLMARCKDGSERPIRALILKANVDGEEFLAAAVRDAAGDTETQRRLQQLAESDPLTGLLNRRGFVRIAAEKIETARGRDHPMSVAVLDLDHLKKINDTHGHAVGDAVITRIARVISKNIRQNDAAGRLGGDEFVILFDGAGPEIAEGACQRIRDELSDSAIRLDDAIVDGITLSGGISGIVSTDRTIDAALARADSLMYSAKQMGRNTVHVTG